MKTAIQLIVKERKRQIRKGYTPQSDDRYTDSRLSEAAAAYMLPPEFDNEGPEDFTRGDIWPWWPSSFKRSPDDRIKELVKACALGVAEIERLQRKEAKGL